jgi:indolepyruvate ferredoxin oxidoreductase, beta subunit
MSPNAVTNVLVVGIGGQSIVLLSSIIADAAIRAGFDVKANEVHGMAQRGGTVLAQVRFGAKVYSPLLWEGTADLIVSLEKAEALRFAHFLKPGALAVVSDQVIVPVTVSAGRAKYPEDADERLERAFPRLARVDALGIAERLGNAKAANLVALGAASRALASLEEHWEAAIGSLVPKKHLAINLKAFEAGRRSQE